MEYPIVEIIDNNITCEKCKLQESLEDFIKRNGGNAPYTSPHGRLALYEYPFCGAKYHIRAGDIFPETESDADQ